MMMRSSTFSNRKVAIITGVSGFVGRYLSRLFLSDGWVVLGFSRKPGKSERSHPRYISASYKDLNKIYRKSQKIDLLLHCASATPHNTREEDIIGANQNLVENVLQMIDIWSVKNVLNFSSLSVYGMFDCDVIEETTALKPINVYGKSKLYAEEAFSEIAAKNQELQVTSVRLPGIVGPLSRDIFLSKVAQLLIQNADATLFNKNSMFNSIVHANTIFNLAIFLTAHFRKGHHIYNLAASNPLELNAVIKRFRLCLNSDSQIIWIENSQKNPVISTARLTELGFHMPTVINEIDRYCKDLKNDNV